MAIDNGALI